MSRTIVPVLLLACACGPKMPDEASARAAFEERRAKVENFEEALTRLLSMRQLEESDVARMVVAADGLGFDTVQAFVPSVEPAPPGRKHGAVDPDAGITIDRFRVGWGLYQTAWEDASKHGDGDYHPGIAVKWSMGDPDSPLAEPVTMWFLLDGTKRPE
jgi:hypothetical protein